MTLDGHTHGDARPIESRVAILHVGTHKTGTTSFQALADANRAELLNRGILYPRAGAGFYGPGHNNLVREILGSGEFIERLGGFKSLEDEVRSVAPRHLLLSAEDLHTLIWHPEYLTSIRDDLIEWGFTPSVIICLRDISDYKDSLFSQLQFQGLRIDRETFEREASEQDSVSTVSLRYPLNYELVKDRLADVFGKENLHVVPYQSNNMSQVLASALTPLVGQISDLFADEFVLNTREDRLEVLERRLRELQQSHSWQMTRPFRAMFRALQIFRSNDNS